MPENDGHVRAAANQRSAHSVGQSERSVKSDQPIRFVQQSHPAHGRRRRHRGRGGGCLFPAVEEIIFEKLNLFIKKICLFYSFFHPSFLIVKPLIKKLNLHMYLIYN